MKCQYSECVTLSFPLNESNVIKIIHHFNLLYINFPYISPYSFTIEILSACTLFAEKLLLTFQFLRNAVTLHNYSATIFRGMALRWCDEKSRAKRRCALSTKNEI